MSFEKPLKGESVEAMGDMSTKDVSDTNYLSELEEKTINYLKGEHNEEEEEENADSDREGLGNESEHALNQMDCLNLESDDRSTTQLESVKEVDEENKVEPDELTKKKQVFEKHRTNKL